MPAVPMKRDELAWLKVARSAGRSLSASPRLMSPWSFSSSGGDRDDGQGGGLALDAANARSGDDDFRQLDLVRPGREPGPRA